MSEHKAHQARLDRRDAELAAAIKVCTETVAKVRACGDIPLLDQSVLTGTLQIVLAIDVAVIKILHRLGEIERKMP
jgi:hypothetical protein